VLAKVSNDGGSRAGSRDYAAAQRTVLALRQQGKLNEAQLVDFAKTGQYEETVASLALLCSVPIEGCGPPDERRSADPVLILGKTAGWGWATVRAISWRAPAASRRRAAPRRCLCEFRTSDTRHRSARDAVLAGEACGRGHGSLKRRRASSTPKDQIAGRAPFTLGLGFVARAR